MFIRALSMAELNNIFKLPMHWQPLQESDGEFIYSDNDIVYKLRINDFPEENLFTVFAGEERVDFDDMPDRWEINYDG